MLVAVRRCSDDTEKYIFVLIVVQMDRTLLGAPANDNGILETISDILFTAGQRGVLKPGDLSPAVARQADAVAKRRLDLKNRSLGHRWRMPDDADPGARVEYCCSGRESRPNLWRDRLLRLRNAHASRDC